MEEQSEKKTKIKFQAPTGMHDLFGDDLSVIKKISDTASHLADYYGFQQVDTPIMEDIQIYEKSTGTSSDIVEKEMYVLKTKGGDTLCLRPEFTPGIVRAYLQNGMFMQPKPVKIFSVGPLFRYEKPQAGRYRQFHQFNFEMFGSKDPALDAEMIQIFCAILEELKIKNIIVEINNIGCTQCRPYFRKTLVKYLKSKESLLSSESRERLKKNPLRILDSKDERDREVIAQAPQIVDYLCEDCHNHFKKVLEYLDQIGIPYRLNPYLVRGLDYYTKTVFEIIEEGKDQTSTSTLIGGGRYDSLIKSMGGPDTPALGGAGGIERIAERIKEQSKGKEIIKKQKVHLFLAPLGEAAKKATIGLIEDLRKENIRVFESVSKDSLKNQLSLASKLGIEYTLILGQREVLDGTAIIRNMKDCKQEVVKMDKVVKELKKRLKK